MAIAKSHSLHLKAGFKDIFQFTITPQQKVPKASSLCLLVTTSYTKVLMLLRQRW